MLLYPFPTFITLFLALVTPFHRTFITKDTFLSTLNLSFCLFLAIVTYIIYRWKSYRLYQWRSHNCNHSTYKSTLSFFISCFTVSMTPSINGVKISSDLAVLVTSFILSFGISKVHLFLALTDPRTLILFSIYLLQTKLF